jgi:hypothetical protein
MPPKPLPKSVLNAVALVVKPYFGHAPTTEEVSAALESIRVRKVSLKRLAESRGITSQSMLNRLRKAGVEPIQVGGHWGKEFIYDAKAVVGI